MSTLSIATHVFSSNPEKSRKCPDWKNTSSPLTSLSDDFSKEEETFLNFNDNVDLGLGDKCLTWKKCDIYQS